MKVIKMMQSLGTELAAPLEASKRLANAHQNNIFFKSHFKNINCDPWTCESERKDGAFPVKLASWKFSFHQHALPISVLGSSSTLKNFERVEGGGWVKGWEWEKDWEKAEFSPAPPLDMRSCSLPLKKGSGAILLQKGICFEQEKKFKLKLNRKKSIHKVEHRKWTG